MNRDLDAEIVQEIMGWKLRQVGPDCAGLNSCQIYWPPGGLPEGFEFPTKGEIHRGFLAPDYSSDWIRGIELARFVGLRTPICDTPETPEELCLACLEYWRNLPIDPK